MAATRSQFQKGISLNAFLSLYAPKTNALDRNGACMDSAVSGIFLGFQAAKSRSAWLHRIGGASVQCAVTAPPK